MAFWRRDGKELYYLGADRGSQGGGGRRRDDNQVRQADACCSGRRTRRPVAPGTASISRDGERIVIAVPPPQLRQLTVLDRAGKGGEHGRAARSLRPAGALPRRQAGRGDEKRSADRKQGHLDVRCRDRQRDADHQRHAAGKRARSGRRTASRWPTCRRAGTTPASIERRRMAPARRNCCSATRRAPGWSSPTGRRMESS